MIEISRLTYVSKNLIQGSEAEISDAIEQILEVSRRKNALVDVTGTLMFNGKAFAQVLEGEQRYIDSIFDAIKSDCRHCQINVLQYAIAKKRHFSNWSMAFVGQSLDGNAIWGSIGDKSGFDVLRLDTMKIFSLMYRIVQMSEDTFPEHHQLQRGVNT